jgi:hypothetical protein
VLDDSVNQQENRRCIMKNLYNFLLVIGGVALLYAILVLMPMLFTYMSSGDLRP